MRLWERAARRTARSGPARGESRDWSSDLLQALTQSGGGGTSMSAIDEERVLSASFDAYKGNSIIFALISARLQLFSQIKFQWTRFDNGRPGDLFGSSALSLLEAPWPGGTTQDLLARMEVDVSAAGNCYLWRRGNRLHRLRPEWVTMVIGSQFDPDNPVDAPDATLLGYVYQRPGGEPVGLDTSEVVHYAPIPDPESVFLGQSWITPSIEDVGADNASTIHKRAFFQNAATPNLAFKFDPSVTKAQIEGFKEVIEAGHVGSVNAYKTLYLGGGADPVTVGKDFRELEFSATQGKGESRLASAAGVPPSWVGFSEGLQGSALNAGNFTAARRRFGDGTMRHLWQAACSAFESVITPPQGARLWYSDHIAFFAEDAMDQADIKTRDSTTITALVREGFTPESVITAVTDNDWSRLVHTGLLSVQLQEPGAESPADSGGSFPSGGESEPPAGTDDS